MATNWTGVLIAMGGVAWAAGCAADRPVAEDWRDRADRTIQARLAETRVDSGQARDSDGSAHLRAVAPRQEPAVLLARGVEAPRLSMAALDVVEPGDESTDGAADPATPDDTRGDATFAPGEPAESADSTGQDEARPSVRRTPLPSFRATLKRDLQEMPSILWSDTKAAFGNPWNLMLLASAGGASIALRTTGADDQVDRNFQQHNFYNSCWADTFGALGNPATHFALAGAWWLAGQRLQDDKTYEVGRQLFSALTITGVTTMALKVAAWDDSPNGEWGAWPSGHTSSTMAVATVLNGAYGPLVGVPMFGLTGLVAIERMDSREHWLSDVVFGAVLGWVVGETVVKEHRPQLLGGEVVPYIDPVRGGGGVAWLKMLGNDTPRLASR